MAIALDKELRKAGESGCFGSEKAMEGKNLGPERQIKEPSSQCAKACVDILRHRLKNTANSDGEQRRFVRITRVDEAFADPPGRGRSRQPRRRPNLSPEKDGSPPRPGCDAFV
jgi:hypothetical protein